MDDFICMLKDWQTLVAGLIAVVATAVGAYLLWRQTAQTKETIEDARIRALDKARALAQFGLVSLSNAVDFYAAEIGFILENGTRSTNGQFRGWPRASLEALTNLLVHCEVNDRQQFGELFNSMQVLESRLEGLTPRQFRNTFSPHQSWYLNACMLAQVKSGIDSLFPYCRFKEASFPKLDQHLPQLENTFHFWSIDLDGDPNDPSSNISTVRRWLTQTYSERQKPWPSRIPTPK